MGKVPLCALLLSCNLACSRSALDDNLGQTIASGGYAATSSSPATAAGGGGTVGGTFGQGGTGGVNAQGGMGNIAGTAQGGAAGAAPLCKTNDFFGERLLSAVNSVGGPPAQIVTTSDVNGDQWPDVVLSYGTLLSVMLGAGNGEFAKRQDYTFWSEMTSPIATDLNKDGYLDVVVAFPGSNRISAFMGNSQGIDDYQYRLTLPSLSSPRLVAAGDLDANGTIDLVVSDGTSYLEVLVGEPSGIHFTVGSSFTVAKSANYLRVADLNNDAILDLITLGPTGGLVAYLGKGDGTFGSSVETAYTGTPTSLALGSLNGDAYLDLLTGDSGSMIEWFGKGDGNFTPLSSPGVTTVAAEIADLDADGFNDIVAAEANGRLCSWQGSNDMAPWPDPFCPTVLVDPYALGVADFDRDGTRDVIVSSKTIPALFLSWGGPERRRTIGSRLWEFDMGTSTAALAVADLSADGIPDVVMAPVDAAHIRLTLGTGNGQLAYGRLVYTDSPARALATADFDNDGMVDFAAITTKNSLVISKRDEGIVASLSLDKPFDLMAVADLNKDGRMDLVLVEKGSTAGATLFGQGRNTFTWGKGFVSARPIEGIAVGDLDGDGIADLALATKPSVVEVSQGVGDGSFANSNLFSGGGGVSGLRIADFNEDGIPDLIAGSDYAGASLLLGKGNLNFDFSIYVSTGVSARDVVVADFDGDGHLDVLASDLQSIVLGLALGKGDGTFPYYFEFLAGVVPAQVAVGDLNRDGRPDLVMRSPNATSFARLLNLCR